MSNKKQEQFEALMAKNHTAADVRARLEAEYKCETSGCPVGSPDTWHPACQHCLNLIDVPIMEHECYAFGVGTVWQAIKRDDGSIWFKWYGFAGEYGEILDSPGPVGFNQSHLYDDPNLVERLYKVLLEDKQYWAVRKLRDMFRTRQGVKEANWVAADPEGDELEFNFTSKHSVEYRRWARRILYGARHRAWLRKLQTNLSTRGAVLHVERLEAEDEPLDEWDKPPMMGRNKKYNDRVRPSWELDWAPFNELMSLKVGRLDPQLLAVAGGRSGYGMTLQTQRESEVAAAQAWLVEHEMDEVSEAFTQRAAYIAREEAREEFLRPRSHLVRMPEFPSKLRVRVPAEKEVEVS